MIKTVGLSLYLIAIKKDLSPKYMSPKYMSLKYVSPFYSGWSGPICKRSRFFSDLCSPTLVT